MAELAARHRAVAVDVGTGDGAYARRLAAADPGLLVVGVDANADNLRYRAGRPPPRLEEGFRTCCSGGSRWSMRPARSRGSPTASASCCPGARCCARSQWGSPTGWAACGALARRARRSRSCSATTISTASRPRRCRPATPTRAWRCRPMPIGAAEAAALGTTWAKRLARSDPERRFWRLSGRAVAPPQARQRSSNRVLSSATRPLSRGSTRYCSPRR